jgi:hypothetical protein
METFVLLFKNLILSLETLVNFSITVEPFDEEENKRLKAKNQILAMENKRLHAEIV